MSAPDRWGRHGDQYEDDCGQPRRLAAARADEAVSCGKQCLDRMGLCRLRLSREHCHAWRVGHHAGRVFRMREQAREIQR